MIEVVTFDLWDTVLVDDSDEITRKSKGLSTKFEERRQIIERYLSKTEPVLRAQVDAAYDTVDAAFRHVWYQQGITWTVSERVGILLKGLHRDLPEPDFDEVVRLHEEMELENMPTLAPGIEEAIKQLHGKYKLAVISDTIFSPGRVLKQILKKYGLVTYFKAFVFSDEVGFSKPDPRVFQLIAEQLDCDLDKIAHIGDREEKDVAGPQAVTAKAVLTTVVKDRGSSETKADAVCHDYTTLSDILSTLSK